MRSPVEISGLTVRFVREGQPLTVIDGLDLTVRDDEFVCVIGQSGAGKTTLLNVLAGLVEPTAGSVVVHGKPVAGPGPDCGVVFQDDAVFPWLTVRRNLEYPLRARRVRRRERDATVERFLSLVGLTGFRNSWPRELSGGMRKRVDLARVYVADPKLLLMDEPFGSLDVQTKRSLQAEVQRLWLTDNRATIFITHDLEEALFLGTRIVVLSRAPARVIADVHVERPMPRGLTDRLADDSIAIRRELERLLTDGTEEGSGGELG